MNRVDILLGQIHNLPLDSGGDATKGRVGEGQLQATRRDGILEKGEERRRDSLLSSRGGPPDSPVSIIVVVSIGIPAFLVRRRMKKSPTKAAIMKTPATAPPTIGLHRGRSNEKMEEESALRVAREREEKDRDLTRSKERKTTRSSSRQRRLL